MIYTLKQCEIDYVAKLRRKGQNPYRAVYGFELVRYRFGDNADVNKLKREDFEGFIDERLASGTNPNTVHANLSPVMAAIRHAHKRGHITSMPVCDLPSGPEMERRPLTLEEYKVVLDICAGEPRFERLHRFYIVAGNTGARSQAIEQCEWLWGVNFAHRVIDFNPPQRRITPNKRRPAAFPIAEPLLEILAKWKAEAKDTHVIGLGESGRCTSTYHQANFVVRELAGFKDPTLVPRHCTRKMFVTQLADRMIEETGQADMETIGELVKDNPDMLRKRYKQALPQRLRATAALLRLPT